MTTNVLRVVLAIGALCPSLLLYPCCEKSGDMPLAEEVHDASNVEETSSDMPGAGEVRPENPDAAGCKNVRYPNDWRVPEDFCWDPPAHYCSMGASEVVTKACAPDMSVCCMYPNSCIPCGWVTCSYCADESAGVEVACEEGMERSTGDEVPECEDAPVSVPDAPMCPVIDWDQPICRD